MDNPKETKNAEELKDFFMIKLGGNIFKCENCESNVFRKTKDESGIDVFECVICGNIYVETPKQEVLEEIEESVSEE